MQPFVLRRLKTEVLHDLPHKYEEVIQCALIEKQQSMYNKLIAQFSKRIAQEKDSEIIDTNESGTGMMMQLRKLANHPLLIRDYFDEEKLKVCVQSKKQTIF